MQLGLLYMRNSKKRQIRNWGKGAKREINCKASSDKVYGGTNDTVMGNLSGRIYRR